MKNNQDPHIKAIEDLIGIEQCKTCKSAKDLCKCHVMWDSLIGNMQKSVIEKQLSFISKFGSGKDSFKAFDNFKPFDNFKITPRKTKNRVSP